MAGSQDRIINPLAVEDFCKNAPLIDFKIWTGLFHEIHNEPDHLKVLRFALMWIDENN
jgi:alpha-beta hydrolase superfamily lysophospholipase